MKASLPEPEIISRKGKPVAVILPIKMYREMIERLDDAEDVAYLRKARRKPMQYRPLDDVLADLAKKA
jgi:PHD/YefM family antitoxin component YafN of YafNO toxin-antitoxin module